MPSDPVWVTTHRQAPPDATGTLPGALGRNAPQGTVSGLTTDHFRACIERSRFGGVCRLRPTLESGEHHG